MSSYTTKLIFLLNIQAAI